MINLREECEGYYKIEAVKPDGTRRLLADWFPNLILDAGLDRMGANADYLNQCQVGSGSSAPATTQSSLAALVASTSSKLSDTSSNSGSSPYFAARLITYRFAQGVATGVLAEVGVGWQSSGGLYSRALILDASGDPTTITVLPDESLDVTYQLRMYVLTGETASSITLKSILHSVISKTAMSAQWDLSSINLNAGTTNNVGAFTGTISADITGQPSGTLIGNGQIVAAAYTPGSLSRTFEITAGLPTWNNASGIGAVLVSGAWGNWQIGFTPNIMKTASDILTLQVRHSWGRKV